MLIATVMAILLIFGFGGGPLGDLMTKYTEDPMKATIVDKQRRKMALNELDLVKKTIKMLNDDIFSDIKQFHKLVKDYNSTPQDFDNLYSRFTLQREKEITTLLEQRSAMLKYVTADEWQTIMRTAKSKMAAEQKK